MPIEAILASLAFISLITIWIVLPNRPRRSPEAEEDRGAEQPISGWAADA